MATNSWLSPILAVFPVGGVFVLLWLRSIRTLAQYLYDNHLKIYTQLGSPVIRSLFKTYPKGRPDGNKRRFYFGSDGFGMRTSYSRDEISSLFQLIGFIVSGRFKKIQDEELTYRAGRARFYFFGCLIVISIIFCLTILYGIEKREHLITAQSSALVSPEQIAYELYKSGSYEKALEEFDKLLRTESANRDLWLFRGFTHEKMNNYAAALSDMLHVIKLDQDYFLAYQHVDWLYAREGRWQDIVDIWDKYLARHPYSGEAFLERAGTYKHKGDVQASQADLEKACNYKSAEACRILQRNH